MRPHPQNVRDASLILTTTFLMGALSGVLLIVMALKIDEDSPIWMESAFMIVIFGFEVVCWMELRKMLTTKVSTDV